MRSHKIIILALAAIFFSAGITAGCTVAFDSNQEGLFPCESNSECIDGYECDTTQKVCVEISLTPDDAPPCDQVENPEGDIDLDNDGYGTGDNRANCPNPTADCDDANMNRHPNHAELCDGIDNDCDAEGLVDDFTCPSGSSVECGTPMINNEPIDSVSYICIEGQCVLQHSIRLTEQCQNIKATCNSAENAFTYDVGGQSYHLADETGQLLGPIAECG